MVFRRVCSLIVVGLLSSRLTCFAADLNHPKVPGFERFYAAPLPKPTDEDEEPIVLNQVTGGRMLLSELNCTSCHQVPLDQQAKLNPKQAPVLDEVGSRVKVEWLRTYLANPHQVKPGTTMPDLVGVLPESERGAAVEALTHFLASTGTVTDGRPDAAAASKGAAVFRRVGCQACHNGTDENAANLETSAALPDLGKKYSAASLMAFLKDPLKVRPSGRMPALGLSDDDLRSIAQHFVREGEFSPNTKFELAYGNWSELPAFDELKPVKTGQAAGFDVAVSERPGDYAIRFTTFVRIATAGEYRFWIGSDDGSRLIIDDQVVIDNNGVHPHQEKSGRMMLAAGFHKAIVEYFQGGGEATLDVQVSSRNLSRQPLAGICFAEPVEQKPVSNPDKPTFVLDTNLATRGRELFATLGCASCHQMKIDSQAVETRLMARPLAQLNPANGCLAATVSGKVPRFDLTSVQRTALAHLLQNRTDEAPSETIHRTMATLNCYACHQRGRLGGVEPARDGAFETLQKEMGDEGRLPPSLTGVGDKLRPDWLRDVLNHGADDRKNYMQAKMPRFGLKNVDSLVSLFGSVDMQPETVVAAEFVEPDYRVKAIGRHLVGGQALSCIKCHDFGPHPSTGVRAISLTSMGKRLRFDWFYRYVLNPQEYRRGTRMPAAWPFGQATIRDQLNGDVNLQVQAVWTYLSDRDKAAVPSGLLREPIELKPQSEPIIYRNFIEGAGTRAIGVGYPEGVNLAFDANDMHVAMIWHGAFIDASRHWTGRGQGFEPPLGDDILALPPYAPFIVLDQPDRPFPTTSARDAGYKFLGYRLDEHQRPIFRYSIDGLVVEDASIPVKVNDKTATLKRAIRVTGTDDSAKRYFRAMSAKKIELSSQGRFRIDDVWTIGIDPAQSTAAVIRESSGRKELLIPVVLHDRKGAINLHYEW